MKEKWTMLSYWRRRWKDWLKPARYTDINVIVAAPTRKDPHVGLMITISTGRRRVMFRCHDLAAWDQLWIIPGEARERLSNALKESAAQAAQITEDERLLYLRREGVGLARLDTGEIVADAERIIRKENND